MSDGRLADHPRQTLRCAECGNEAAKEATGWRAVLTVGDEDAEELEQVAVYCPQCAAREFRVAVAARQALAWGLVGGLLVASAVTLWLSYLGIMVSPGRETKRARRGVSRSRVEWGATSPGRTTS